MSTVKPDRPAPVPHRMDPTNPLPRVRVNQSTHPHYCCGSMPAAVGMLTTRGEITKVNPKSVVLRKPGQSDWRDTDTLDVTFTEARRFGFKPPRSTP